jgi:hypothetical protein
LAWPLDCGLQVDSSTQPKQRSEAMNDNQKLIRAMDAVQLARKHLGEAMMQLAAATEAINAAELPPNAFAYATKAMNYCYAVRYYLYGGTYGNSPYEME